MTSSEASSRMCRVLCILAGFLGAVLAAILAVSGLTAGLGNVLHAFFWMLIILLCCGAVLLKWPLFSRPAHTGLALLGLYLALCLRLSLFDYISGDYSSFLSHWVSSMRGMSVSAALSTPIGDYNMPYLYLLLLISRLPFYDLYCIKIFSVIADAGAALGLAYMAKHFSEKDAAPLFVLLAALFCPTTWLNSAYWGQCDSVYGALAIWGLYCGLRKRSWQSYLLFALSLSFKLQAVFLLPILAFLLVCQRIRLRDVWVFPAAFVGITIPALLGGRSLADTFSIYLGQTQSYPYLTLSAPSFWSLVGNNYYDNFAQGAVLLALCLTVFTIVYFLIHAPALQGRELLALGLIFSLMIPWLLPKMHERYFYLAEMLSLCYAALYPRRLHVPVILMTGGFLSYHLYLFGGTGILSLELVAAIYGLLLLYLVLELHRSMKEHTGTATVPEGGNEHEKH